MARARNIKPGFFENEDLADLPVAARLLFIGLWTLADREGRLEDRPKRIKMQILPMDDLDVDELLQELANSGFIDRYGKCTRQVRCKHQAQYIQILNFGKHQSPHVKEKASTIPAPDKHQTSTRQAQERDVPAPPDSLNPDSLNPDSKTTCAEPPSDSAPAADDSPDDPVVFEMQATGGRTYGVRQSQVDEWSEAFPGVDIMAEMRKSAAWQNASASRRKTHNGMAKHLVGWFERAQNSGRGSGGGPKNPSGPPRSFENENYRGGGFRNTAGGSQ